MDSVAVLMSTYNGEKYIEEQIESILGQSGVELSLFIRDDGSTDGTLRIIERYVDANANVHFVRGDNLGVGNSFMQLLYGVGDAFDYYAFSDQDDVWLPDKTTQAIAFLQKEESPALYASNQTLVDQSMNEIGLRYTEEVNVSYRQIMCKNLIAGCTFVWNRELNNLIIQKDRRPSTQLLRNRIHDVWVAMAASVVGDIIYDNNSYILYRQHDANVVGVKKQPIIIQWIQKIRNSELRRGRSGICREIVESFEDRMDVKTVQELSLYANYRRSLRDKVALLKRQKGISDISHESGLALSCKIMLGLF